MSLSIIDLLTRVGVENVCVQNVHQSAINYRQHKNGDCALTFLTDQASANDGLGTPRKVGLIIWMPPELVERAKETP